MNGYGNFQFTKQNIGKFFNTPTGTLPSKQAGLVKVLSTDFQHSAEAVLETTPAEIAGPILHDMIGAYGKSVAYVIYGWTGNA